MKTSLLPEPLLALSSCVWTHLECQIPSLIWCFWTQLYKIFLGLLKTGHSLSQLSMFEHGAKAFQVGSIAGQHIQNSTEKFNRYTMRNTLEIFRKSWGSQVLPGWIWLFQNPVLYISQQTTIKASMRSYDSTVTSDENQVGWEWIIKGERLSFKIKHSKEQSMDVYNESYYDCS